MMKVVYCPANAWDCPYFTKEGYCSIYPEEDPIKECDDFAYFWEEGEDYVVDTEEDENINYEEEIDLECGFDPYLGCYTDDC